MKQNVKKSLMLLLAVVMIVSMSVTAYAQTGTPSTFVTDPNAPITVNLSVKYYDRGEEETVILPTETMRFNPAGFTTTFYVDPSANYANLNKPTVMDALYKISVDRFENIPVPEIGWDTYSTPNGAYISKYYGLDTVTVDSGSNYWKGYSWVLRINGQVQQYGSDYNVIPANPDNLVKAMSYGSSHLLNNPVTGGFQQVNYIEFSYEYVEENW